MCVLFSVVEHVMGLGLSYYWSWTRCCFTPWTFGAAVHESHRDQAVSLSLQFSAIKQSREEEEQRLLQQQDQGEALQALRDKVRRKIS